jgi:autophagy-related protein 2
MTVNSLPLQVVIDRVNLRLHLCADTMTAVTLFAGHLSAAFNPPDEEQYESSR